MALGVFLRSIDGPLTYWTFEDTLSQIGLGYTFLFLLAVDPPSCADCDLHGHPGGFLGGVRAVSVARSGLRLQAVGVPEDWAHLYTGFVAHCNKNSNLAWAADVWFLNVSARGPFQFNGGWLRHAEFIPTLATMILGLVAGGWLKTPRSPGRNCAASRRGVALTIAGFGLDWLQFARS